MAISPVRSDSIGQLLANPSGSQANRTRENASPERAERRDAIRVELSPEARKAAQNAAVTNANHQAAASADFLSSPEGRSALPRRSSTQRRA
jgi:hypothetical protein